MSLLRRVTHEQGIYQNSNIRIENEDSIRTFRRKVIADTRVNQPHARTLIRVPGMMDPVIYLEETFGFRVSVSSRLHLERRIKFIKKF